MMQGLGRQGSWLKGLAVQSVEGHLGGEGLSEEGVLGGGRKEKDHLCEY